MCQPLVAVFAALLVVASTERTIVALEKWDRLSEDAVLRSVDFRGAYGPAANLALVIRAEGDSLSGGIVVGPYDDTTSLWVVECPSSTDCAKHLNNTLRTFEVAGRGGVGSHVVKIVQSETPPVADEAMSVISVPQERVVPRVSSSKAVNVTNDPIFDPVIQLFVTAVSRSNLENNVRALSEFFTRLATATDAWRAQEYLVGRFQSLGLPVTTSPFRDDMSDNVCAELRGRTNPDALVIVGAHYDSRAEDVMNPNMRAPGADDNASGSSMVLELARVLSQYTSGFRNTVRFCLWSGEERGLIGSRAYALDLKNQGANVVCYLNGDMLGYKASAAPMLVGMKDRFVSMPRTEQANALTRMYVPNVPIAYSPSCCSDQQSFYEQGFDAVAYFESEQSASANPNYHRTTDLPDTLDFDLEHMMSRAMVAMLGTLADPIRA